ncbi:MAG: hypothetical protein HF982_00730 [Desulfobacteraceae bacterium]|nr:hypothetical protein [Desulfobacteraceae bacterium]MBC2718125.1 hypothetical protein [Desulfobacteraceae bacterium]
METKEDNKSCDEEMGSAGDAGNPQGGQLAGPAQGASQDPRSEGTQEQVPAQEGNKGNPEPQTAGDGNMGFQPGPVPGQMPFPYGYFQSPNLQPGYYMTQGGLPQGQMPGYWMPPGYGVFPPYMQPVPAAPQGAGQVIGVTDPGNPRSQQPQGQPEGQPTNPAGLAAQAHDAPGTAADYDNTGYAQGNRGSGQRAAPGHHKEPGQDELQYGTEMEKPDHVSPGHPPGMAEDVSAPSGLASFFQLDNDSFWKGILKASASVKGGVEELKEQLADVEAEVLHDINEKKK